VKLCVIVMERGKGGGSERWVRRGSAVSVSDGNFCGKEMANGVDGMRVGRVGNFLSKVRGRY